VSLTGAHATCPKLSKGKILQIDAQKEKLWKRFEDNTNVIHQAADLKVVDDLIVSFN
jgi:hypothetical protein